MKESRIRAYLDKYLVKHTELASEDKLRDYVLQMLTVPGSVTKTACSTDPHRLMLKSISSYKPSHSTVNYLGPSVCAICATAYFHCTLTMFPLQSKDYYDLM